MAVRFVLINTVPSKKHDVYNTLFILPTIAEMPPLCDEYALIAHIQDNDFETLGNNVLNDIRTINRVIDTKTSIGTRGYLWL